MNRNSHLQRFLNSNNEYLIKKLLQDKFILDILCLLYLCNKACTIDNLIYYCTSDEYEYKKSITHLKDVLKTLVYFKLILMNNKIVKLNRRAIQLIELKKNVTRATTSLDYNYINIKSQFIISALIKLKLLYYRAGKSLDLLNLCRLEGQASSIKNDIIIVDGNIVIIFNALNNNIEKLRRKANLILINKRIDIDKTINIIYEKDAYIIDKNNINQVFNQFEIKIITI